jgi:hypothetical protein
MAHKPVMIMTISAGTLGGAGCRAHLHAALDLMLARVTVTHDVMITAAGNRIRDCRLLNEVSLGFACGAVEALLAEIPMWRRFDAERNRRCISSQINSAILPLAIRVSHWRFCNPRPMTPGTGAVGIDVLYANSNGASHTQRCVHIRLTYFPNHHRSLPDTQLHPVVTDPQTHIKSECIA